MSVSTPVTLELASDVRLVDVAHSVAEQVASRAGFAEEAGLDFGLAVREVVINAMVHGNARRLDVPVELRFEVEGETLRARIRDRGRGFDLRAAPDPTDPEHRLKVSGRGLLMARAYCDAVDFRYEDGRGLEVVLSKRLNWDQGRPGA